MTVYRLKVALTEFPPYYRLPCLNFGMHVGKNSGSFTFGSSYNRIRHEVVNRILIRYDSTTPNYESNS